MIRLLQYNQNTNEHRRESLYSYYKDHKNTVIIKTCRRVEVYTGDGEIPKNVVLHLFRLAAGLESPIPGDTAIQGQIKKAYEESRATHELDKYKHRLFQLAIENGKEVRTKTAISKGCMSYAQGIARLIEKETVAQAKNIAIVGINKITIDLLSFLKKINNYPICIINRNAEKADSIAQTWQTDWCQLDDANETLNNADIIVAATSANHAIIHREHLTKPKNRVIIDVGSPANVSAEVRNGNYAKIYTLDHIEQSILSAMLLRKEEVIAAEKIVNKNVEKFLKWQKQSFSYIEDIKTLNYA